MFQAEENKRYRVLTILTVVPRGIWPDYRLVERDTFALFDTDCPIRVRVATAWAAT